MASPGTRSLDGELRVPTLGFAHYSSTSSTESAVSAVSQASSTFCRSPDSGDVSDRLSEDENEYVGDDEDDGPDAQSTTNFLRLRDAERSRSLTPQPKRKSWQAIMRERTMMRRSGSAEFPSHSSVSTSPPPVIMTAPRRSSRPASTKGVSGSEAEMSASERPSSIVGLPLCSSLTFDRRTCVSAPSSPCSPPSRRFSDLDGPDSPNTIGSHRGGNISFPLTVRDTHRKPRTRTSTMPGHVSPSRSPANSKPSSPFSLRRLRLSLGSAV